MQSQKLDSLARKAAAPVFIAAMFSSAALIFALQPLFGRLVTPLLGGSPAVWNTSMAFFQGALLIGYLYAHLLARLRDLKLQAGIHVALLIVASLVLPIHVTEALGAPNSDHPALWLLGVLTLSVGAPFAIASATAPLLQSWYARSGRKDAHDPYYLYAASNLGSFIGLLAYPALIEPLLDTNAQGGAWASFYVFVTALIVLAGATVIAAHGPAPSESKPLSAAPEWRRRLYWIATAAVPSALTLGVTMHISTDVASAPMLWVVPLALYLATFIIAFARGGEKWSPLVLAIHPPALAILVAAYFAHGNWGAALSGNLIGFTLSALICHFALARTRPAADRLTEFYFFVSLGGVLGGAFAAFLAPVIFNNVYEYPLALAAAALFRPKQISTLPRLANAALAGAIAMAVLAALLILIEPQDAVLAAGAVGAAAALIAAGWRMEEGRPSPLRIGFLVAGAVFALTMLLAAFNAETLFRQVLVGEHRQMMMTAPWNVLIIVSGLFVLGFSVHAVLQKRSVETRVEDAALGVSIVAALLAICLALMGERLDARVLIVIGLGVSVVAIFVNRARPAALAAMVLAAFVMIFLDNRRGGEIITQERSFFGVLRTEELHVGHASGAREGDVVLRILMHGTTIHGAQLQGPGVTRLPLTYYNPHTALGEATVAGLSLGDANNVALIGLGAGATSCLLQPQDRLTIYEIDPAVVRLSGVHGTDFSYVRECQPNAHIELGDARLQIAQAPNHSYDVIVVDAFSSDAIPAHLLTREALALYLSKTTDRGIVVLHLSNRNLALVSEAARVAFSLNVPYLWRISERVPDQLAGQLGGLPASVMIVARTPETLLSLPISMDQWRIIAPPEGRPWSDAYINIPRALWENLDGQEQCRLHPDAQGCETPN
jgi:hypothetical protein